MAEPTQSKPPRRSFFSGLAALASLGIAVTGVLRAFGALRSLSLWQQRGLPAWILPYLLAAGLLNLALGLAAYYLLQKRPKAWMRLYWGINLLVLLIYWLERLLLWTPAERGGAILFVAALHLLWLGLMGTISLQERGKERNDG